MTVSPPGAAPAATIGRRVGAFAIDVGIAYAIGAVLVGIVVGIVFGVGPAWERDGLAVMILLSYVGIGFLLFVWWLVYSAMQGGRGGSIGQRILGLRVQDAGSGTPIGFWRAVWRNIVFSLAGSIVVGYFTPLFDSSGRHQGWHDMAARAVVVDVRKIVPVPAAPAPVATANPYLPPPTGAATLPPASPLQPAAPVPSAGFMPAAPAAPAAPSSRPVAPAAPIGTGVIDGVPWITHEPPASKVARPPEPAASFPAVTMPFPAATTTEPLGATAAPTAVAPAAPAPGAAPGGPASVPLPAAEEDVDSTRIVPPPAQRAALYDGAPVVAVLSWDDGTRMAVYGRTLYGRNPANEDGAVAIAVRDETLSLSKTHFEIGGDSTGAWIIDRHSTNGTTLVRDGGRFPLAAGVRTALRHSDALEFGDRRVTVEIA